MVHLCSLACSPSCTHRTPTNTSLLRRMVFNFLPALPSSQCHFSVQKFFQIYCVACCPDGMLHRVCTLYLVHVSLHDTVCIPWKHVQASRVWPLRDMKVLASLTHSKEQLSTASLVASLTRCRVCGVKLVVNSHTVHC